MKKFILFDNNAVYKQTTHEDGHYIKISPWEVGEDRRMSKEMIIDALNNGTAKSLNKTKAKEIVNQLFRKIDYSWIHDNKLYCVFSDNNPRAFLYNNLTNAVQHKYPYYGNLTLNYYLVYYNGKIYWAHIGQYYPRVMLYEFQGGDTEPGLPCMRTSVKHVKIIYQRIGLKNYKPV